jgi:hypothetical protein
MQVLLKAIVNHRFGVLTLTGVFVLAILVIVLTAARWADAFSLVVRAADFQGPLRRVADVSIIGAAERLARVPTPHGSVRARVYSPLSQTPQHTAMLVSGLHPAGIDEPRLMTFVRELAKTGVTVLTPDIPGLAEFEITSKLTDSIEHVAVWLATDSQLAPAGRVGLIGISTAFRSALAEPGSAAADSADRPPL